MALEFKHEITPDTAAMDLWQIAETGDIDALDEILALGADINAVNNEGVTALMRAAAHGRTQMVEALIDSGADINVTRADGFSALTLAAFFGHKKVAQLLVEHGANLNLATRSGTWADTWASARSFQELAEYLHRARCTNCSCDLESTTEIKHVFSEEHTLTPPEIAAAVQLEGAELDSRAVDITIETQPVKLSDVEEDEYEWIARSTAPIQQSFVDEWSGSESIPSQPVDYSDIQEEIVAPNSSIMDDAIVIDEWSAPELIPSQPIAGDINADEQHEIVAAPTIEEAIVVAEWSGPELTPSQPANLSDLDADEHEEMVASAASTIEEDSVLAEWTGPELMPPPVELNDSEASEDEETDGSTASTSVVAEWTGAELTPPPIDLKDIDANEDEEIAGSTSTLEEESAVDDLSEVTVVVPVQRRPFVLPVQAESFVAPVQARSFVARSLSDPPEIWDQVPEQPADFHPAVAFMARVTADNRKLLLVTLGVMFICGVCTFAVLKLRQVDRDDAVLAQAQSEHRMEVQPPTASERVATSEPTAAESAKSSSEPANAKSSGASVDSSAADNKRVATETAKNSSEPEKNSAKRNAVASAQTAATKRKDSPQPESRPKAKSASLRSASTNSKSDDSRNAPLTGRKSEPAPAISVGDGETRPRVVSPRTTDTKGGARVSQSQIPKTESQNPKIESPNGKRVSDTRASQNRPEPLSTRVISPAPKSTTSSKPKVIPWP